MEKGGGGACPKPMKATSNGVFQGENPLDHALPLLILQICIVVLLTRLLAFLLKPLRQPRVIAEIIGGVLLGPSALGKNKKFLHTIFPSQSLTVLDTVANLGLLFFLFLVGMELDPGGLRRTGRKTLTIAAAGISVPFLMGTAASFALLHTIARDADRQAAFVIFMGVSLSITAFPVLARILAELKLLTTDVGRTAMAAAAVNDVAAWVLLALAIAVSGTTTSPLAALWVLLCGAAFVLLCACLVPAAFRWVERRCAAGEAVAEGYVCAALVAVMAAGFVTDSIGIHALFGGFVVGVLVPKEGALGGALAERVEDLVSGIFLPLYFVSSGLKTDVAAIKGGESWCLLGLVILTACSGKIVSTVVVALWCRVGFSEALTLGFLMNTKGLVELIVLNIGKDRKVLNDQTFAILVMMALFTTFITTPLVVAVYKPAKRGGKGGYGCRTIEGQDSRTQLRMLICFESGDSIPTATRLMEMSRGGEERRGEGLVVYAMHLMEMSERPSAILMVHRARKNGLPFWNKSSPPAGSTTTVVAFDTFHRLGRVSVRPMTAISSFSTIHHDICASAERKRAAIIILPFHKHKRYDGGVERTRGEMEWVNKKVMEEAPCSVGLLVDRGLVDPKTNPSSQVTLLFFGGPDDREALSYASRISDHPSIHLLLLRFLSPHPSPDDDDPLISAFKLIAAANPSVVYQERVVIIHSEIVSAFKEMGIDSHLFIVGKTPEGDAAPLLSSPDSSSHARECPELGPVGGLLTEMDLPASVLVIQQYRRPGGSLSSTTTTPSTNGN